jgi:cytochrome c oxidase cbb3-type subunit 2
MPGWQALQRQERGDLLAYIKDFCPRFKEEKPEAPLEIPAEPPDSKDSISRGEALYQKMECGKCHGKEGRGNGRSASTLTDTKDRPIVPYDFTSDVRFKCGQTNEDLYRIFMTGLDGTPMPSFRDNIQPNEAWDLVHYLRTLQLKLKHKPQSRSEELERRP